MGFLDRLKKQPSVDQAAVQTMLTDRGASDEQARELIGILSDRLTPAKMHDWLAHPERSHGIPDPESEAKFGATMNWTPINAIAAGKTELVIEEAKRYVDS